MSDIAGSQHLATILKQSVPEILSEVDEQVASLPPSDEKPPEKDQIPSRRRIPRWMLESAVGLLVVALSTVSGAWVNEHTNRLSEQQKHMEQAMIDAKAQFDSDTRIRVSNLEFRVDTFVKKMDEYMARDEAAHLAEGNRTERLIAATTALTKQLAEKR